MMKWIEEPQTLGAIPQECFPAISQCVATEIKRAIDECNTPGKYPDSLKPDCIAYFTDQFAYEKCRSLCPQLVLPIKPPSLSGQLPTPGARPPQRGRVPSTPAKKSSNTGLIVAGVVLGAIALAAVASS